MAHHPVAIDAERQAINVATDLGDEELDEVIQANLPSAIAVGAALTVRRERGTWKTVDGFKTWEEFCTSRYGISRTTAWRTIKAARATQELPPGSTPVSQRAATKVVTRKRAAPPIDATSTVTPPPAPAPPVEAVEPGPEPVPARHAAWANDAAAGMSPLDVLAALLDLDPEGIIADLDPEERVRMAKETRRWFERFELAARGLAAPPQRTGVVTPRFKGGK